MKRILICSLAVVFLFAACKEKKRPTLKEMLKEAADNPGLNVGAGNFNIDAPAGWTKADTSFSGVKMLLMMAPETTTGRRANINVLSEAMQGMSLDKYFDANVTTISGSANQYHFIEKGEKEINGSSFRWLHYSAASPNGTPIEQFLYISSKNNIAYLITCTSFKVQLEKDLLAFDQVLNSFRIH
jgi:hypothetical protein